MKPGRVVALIFGCVLLLPGLALVLTNGAIGVAYFGARDDDGYFNYTVEGLQTSKVAVTAEENTFTDESGSPDLVGFTPDLDVRLEATSATSSQNIFIGIAPESEVDRYLDGVAHNELIQLNDGDPAYRTRSGGETVGAPNLQDFWVASAEGQGPQQLDWELADGQWAVVVMNADASPGVGADVKVGVKADFMASLVTGLIVVSAALPLVGLGLILFGLLGRRSNPSEAAQLWRRTGAERRGLTSFEPSPALLEAQLDPSLSRWKWLIKWFLAIPHYIVLVFLGVAFVILTIVAGFAILFTGHYPRSIFDFNVGVLRWSWRVSYYAGNGGLGTDRYPPFSLGVEPDYPATLDVRYPEQLSRGLVLVKSWLLAIPHYLILGVLLGGWAASSSEAGRAGAGFGLLGILVFIAAVILLFTARYPKSLFDLIIGLNRWVYRVVTYAALMTDEYPPFRLDQGGSESLVEPPSPLTPAPTSETLNGAELEISEGSAPELAEEKVSQ